MEAKYPYENQDIWMEGFAWFNFRCRCFGKQTYKGFGSMSYMHARFRGYPPLNVHL
jgi:hypothetical protein